MKDIVYLANKRSFVKCKKHSFIFVVYITGEIVKMRQYKSESLINLVLSVKIACLCDFYYSCDVSAIPVTCEVKFSFYFFSSNSHIQFWCLYKEALYH